METDDLRQMLMLAEKRSYAATADALFLSPSALSRHIAALENRLGVTLFHRNSRSVLVTRHGELLASYAKKIIQLEDEYLEQLEKVKREDGPSFDERSQTTPNSPKGKPTKFDKSNQKGVVAEFCILQQPLFLLYSVFRPFYLR